MSKPRLVKPEGGWLEQCEARKTYLVHLLEADRAALAAHEANGYRCHSKETVHAGDVVTRTRHGSFGCGVVARANPKTVSVKTQYSWTDKVSYEDIREVLCPHDNPEVAAALAKIEDGESPVSVARAAVGDSQPAASATAEPRPAPVKAERPARPEVAEVDGRRECFTTPPEIVARLIEAADLRPGLEILEPSAGRGAIVKGIAGHGCRVTCIEIDQRNCDALDAIDYGCPRAILCADFLETLPSGLPWGTTFYDRVIMNPPFSDRQDVKHVLHADRFVRFGGLLVAVMSAGVQFRTDKLTEAFRKIVADRGGDILPLPDDAFRNSGTLVRTVMVTLPSPAVAPDAVGTWPRTA